VITLARQHIIISSVFNVGASSLIRHFVDYKLNLFNSSPFKNSFRQKGGLISKHISGLGTNKNFVMVPDGAGNQEWLYWRRPLAISPT
jgi:hypothetical protein